jgi:c(7)-type cytochrome triheme protein
MKRLFISALTVALLFAIAIPAFAVPFGRTVEYTPKGAGRVVFDGKDHVGKGLKCAECHPGLFKMKKEIGAVPITMKEMEGGKGCGACHNGSKVFGVKDQRTCGKCHKT